MKRTLLTLAAIGTLALTACSSPTAAPEPTAAHSPASVATESAEATPAPTKEAPTEMPADDDQPMTAEELDGDGEPMDGDTTTNENEAENIRNYNECVADLEAEYEPDMGMTDDTSICDDILQMNNEIDTQFEMMDGLDIPCVYQLEHKRPELFDGRSMEQIVLDPTIIRKCHN